MKKKAEDLKPGDVVVLFTGARLVLLIEDGETQDRERIFTSFEFGRTDTSRRYFDKDEEWEVESSTLTPAQQHAEELVGLMRAVGEGLDRRCEIHQLLARIDPPKPPKPPSAEELAQVLEGLASDKNATYQEAQAKLPGILDRARAAGMLKDPQ